MIMESQSEVDAEEGQKYAEINGYVYFECGTALGGPLSVQNPFQYIGNHVFQNYIGAKHLRKNDENPATAG